jgi:hypothetical protein
MATERSSVYQFVHGLSQESVAAITKDTLKNPQPPAQTEIFDVFYLVNDVIDFQHVQTLAPAWMNPYGLFDLVAELSSVEVFKNLLLLAPEKFNTANDILRLSLTKDSIDIDEMQEAAAMAFTLNNAEAMTAELLVGLLAPAIGPTVDQCRIYPNETTYASFIGKNYQTQPTSADEYMDRIQLLLPNPDAPGFRYEGTFFSYMQEHGTFTPIGKKCPAIGVTEAILGQVGRELDINKEYYNRFKRTITKAPKKV